MMGCYVKEKHLMTNCSYTIYTVCGTFAEHKFGDLEETTTYSLVNYMRIVVNTMATNLY